MVQISPRVWMWSEIHGEARGEAYPWNSFVISIPSHGVVALVDPLPMSDEEMQELEKIGRPTHILLTCEYHYRNTNGFRDLWDCSVLANRAEAHRYAVDLDGTFEDGETLWDFVELLFVPDVYYPETALLVKENGGILILGDLISGGRKDMAISEGELAVIGPDYIPDLQIARQALRALLGLSFSTICFGHGHPVRLKATETLQGYLDDDRIWRELRKKQLSMPARRAE